MFSKRCITARCVWSCLNGAIWLHRQMCCFVDIAHADGFTVCEQQDPRVLNRSVHIIVVVRAWRWLDFEYNMPNE